MASPTFFTPTIVSEDASMGGRAEGGGRGWRRGSEGERLLLFGEVGEEGVEVEGFCRGEAAFEGRAEVEVGVRKFGEGEEEDERGDVDGIGSGGGSELGLDVMEDVVGSGHGRGVGERCEG